MFKILNTKDFLLDDRPDKLASAHAFRQLVTYIHGNVNLIHSTIFAERYISQQD